MDLYAKSYRELKCLDYLPLWALKRTALFCLDGLNYRSCLLPLLYLTEEGVIQGQDTHMWIKLLAH